MSLVAGLASLQGDAPPFDEDPPGTPGPLFAQWFGFAVAAGVPEPHAMTLSTVDGDGVPDSRVLVLKDFDEVGRWAFASSADSAKGRQLAARPVAALTFWWQPLVRSVRIRGAVVEDTQAASAEDFLARAAGARAAAIAGELSGPVEDRRQLDREFAAAEARVAEDPGLASPSWRKWWLEAEQVEFWQGDPQRRHQRLRYERVGGGWRRSLLRP